MHTIQGTKENNTILFKYPLNEEIAIQRDKTDIFNIIIQRVAIMTHSFNVKLEMENKPFDRHGMCLRGNKSNRFALLK